MEHKRQKLRWLIPTFLLGIALGGLMGWQAAHHKGSAPGGLDGQGGDKTGSNKSGVGLLHRTATPKVKFTPSGNPEKDFRSIQRIRDVASRTRAFRNLLASMSPTEVARLMQVLKTYGEDQEQADQAGGLIAFVAAQQLAIEHAALTDPAAVLAALSTSGKGMQNSDYYKDVLRNWAERDPVAACRFFEQETLTDKTADVRSIAGALVRELVKTDPEGTFHWLRGLKGDFIDDVAHDALQTLSHYDGVTAGRLLAQNSDLKKSPEFVAAMTEGWARTEPDKALAWALTLPSSIAADGVKTASGTWAVKDFDSALAAANALQGDQRAAALSGISSAVGEKHWQELLPLVETLPESADRASAVGEIMGEWVSKSPEEASLWLANEPMGASRDQGVAALAVKTIDNDPESALEWVSTISASDLRQQGVAGLLDTWLSNDPKAARAWVLQTNRLSEEERNRLLEKTGR